MLGDLRVAQARDYLADWLRDEEIFGADSLDWFEACADHVAGLPLTDPRLMLAALCLSPFLDDDHRVDCTMYPGGYTVAYVEFAGWGGDVDEYLGGLVDALALDWQKWQLILTERGTAAEWRLADVAQREAPTFGELREFARTLPPAAAEALLKAAKPRPTLDPGSGAPAPTPKYQSWDEYLRLTTEAQRVAWCRMKAAKANRQRLMSGPPDTKITWLDVMFVLDRAQGRCAHCNSLAVENRPSQPSGAPLPWEHVGRRIGSLSHRIARFNGGSNGPENLCWSCLWCNTWPEERRIGATDHGALP